MFAGEDQPSVELVLGGAADERRVLLARRRRAKITFADPASRIPRAIRGPAGSRRGALRFLPYRGTHLTAKDPHDSLSLCTGTTPPDEVQDRARAETERRRQGGKALYPHEVAMDSTPR